MVDYDTANQRYSFHNLARDFSIVRLKEIPVEHYIAHIHHSAYYLDLLNAADDVFLQGNEGISKGLQKFDEERPNIEAGQSWAALHVSQNELTTRLCMHYADVGAYILNLRQSSYERISWLETALTAARG